MVAILRNLHQSLPSLNSHPQIPQSFQANPQKVLDWKLYYHFLVPLSYNLVVVYTFHLDILVYYVTSVACE